MIESYAESIPQKRTEKKNVGHNFFFKYMWLCRHKNIKPLPEIRKGHECILDLFGDRIKTDDWLQIIDSLPMDQSLRTIAIKLRKRSEHIFENINTESKLRKYRCEPPILSKFVLFGLLQNLGHCLKVNAQIHTLALEGLPLLSKYTQFVLDGISQNHSIRIVSFERSYLLDEGVQMICSTLKYLANIEHVNFSQCELTSKSTEAISDLIKHHSIFRYSEGWKNSLRYRAIDPDSICGLRRISLNRNPMIGNDGLKIIVDSLKDDEWLKAIDMQGCGLSDEGAEQIVNLLIANKQLVIFDIKGNADVSRHVMDRIRKLLGCEVDDLNSVGPVKSLSTKAIIENLREKVIFLEMQLNTEVLNRKRSEELNQHLQDSLTKHQNEIFNNNVNIPNGYTLIEKNVLDKLIKRSAVPGNKGESLSNLRKNTSRHKMFKSLFSVRSPVKELSNEKEIDSKMWPMCDAEQAGDCRIVSLFKRTVSGELMLDQTSLSPNDSAGREDNVLSYRGHKVTARELFMGPIMS